MRVVVWVVVRVVAVRVVVRVVWVAWVCNCPSIRRRLVQGVRTMMGSIRRRAAVCLVSAVVARVAFVVFVVFVVHARGAARCRQL